MSSFEVGAHPIPGFLRVRHRMQTLYRVLAHGVLAVGSLSNRSPQGVSVACVGAVTDLLVGRWLGHRPGKGAFWTRAAVDVSEELLWTVPASRSIAELAIPHILASPNVAEAAYRAIPPTASSPVDAPAVARALVAPLLAIGAAAVARKRAGRAALNAESDGWVVLASALGAVIGLSQRRARSRMVDEAEAEAERRLGSASIVGYARALLDPDFEPIHRFHAALRDAAREVPGLGVRLAEIDKQFAEARRDGGFIALGDITGLTEYEPSAAWTVVLTRTQASVLRAHLDGAHPTRINVPGLQMTQPRRIGDDLVVIVDGDRVDLPGDAALPVVVGRLIDPGPVAAAYGAFAQLLATNPLAGGLRKVDAYSIAGGYSALIALSAMDLSPPVRRRVLLLGSFGVAVAAGALGQINSNSTRHTGGSVDITFGSPVWTFLLLVSFYWNEAEQFERALMVAGVSIALAATVFVGRWERSFGSSPAEGPWWNAHFPWWAMSLLSPHGLRRALEDEGRELFTLQLRHLRYVPNAQPLVQVCLTVTRRAVEAYLGPDEARISSSDPQIAPMARGEPPLLDRAPVLLLAEHPGPLGGGGSGPDGWSYDVNETTILEFRDIQSIDDFVARQQQIRDGWPEAITPVPIQPLETGLAADRLRAFSEPGQHPPTVSPSLHDLLREQLLAAESDLSGRLEQWKQRSAALLRAAFGPDHPLVAEFAKVRFTPALVSANTGQDVFERARRSGIRRAAGIIEGACVELEVTPTLSESKRDMTMASDIFIVHGHDTGALSAVARAVQRVTGKEPVILHEQPDRGRTIIEKFEGHAADAGFVVVLVTGDDLGRPKDSSTERPRARQNVILELGYFIGALGRTKVAIVYDDGVELPSDMAGILYIPRDGTGTWQHKLAKEMRAAGIDVDANRL